MSRPILLPPFLRREKNLTTIAEVITTGIIPINKVSEIVIRVPPKNLINFIPQCT